MNYARKEDFDFLRANYPTIDIKGKICIARYGAIFRGDKVIVVCLRLNFSIRYLIFFICGIFMTGFSLLVDKNSV